MSKILVISPHCDDETYGLGGTILKKLQEGNEVKIFVVCAGPIKFEHLHKESVCRSQRQNEFDNVINFYKNYGNCSGLIGYFTEESMLDTVPIRKIIGCIETQQDDFQADIWYIPGMSYHQDHRKVFEAASAAARPTRKYVPKEIYSYEHPLYSWNPPIWRFTPQVYENISETLENKIKACELYKSQLREGALSIKHIRDYSVACGTECNLQAAERFEVIRVVR